MSEEQNKEIEEDKVEPSEMISDTDKMSLELSKMQRKLALANAEKAIAQNDASEAAYKYLVLQLYMKYGLNPDADVLDENGNILRGYLKK